VEISTNAVLVDATAGSDAGIDRVSSNYAVVAAETTALERLSVEIAQQIAARIARFAQAADGQE
jgi:LPS-assembly lipoprotein